MNSNQPSSSSVNKFGPQGLKWNSLSTNASSQQNKSRTKAKTTYGSAHPMVTPLSKMLNQVQTAQKNQPTTQQSQNNDPSLQSVSYYSPRVLGSNAATGIKSYVPGVVQNKNANQQPLINSDIEIIVEEMNRIVNEEYQTMADKSPKSTVVPNQHSSQIFDIARGPSGSLSKKESGLTATLGLQKLDSSKVKQAPQNNQSISKLSFQTNSIIQRPGTKTSSTTGTSTSKGKATVEQRVTSVKLKQDSQPEDDDFIDDLLDVSMELNEGTTHTTIMTSKQIKDGNKMYQASPSKSSRPHNPHNNIKNSSITLGRKPINSMVNNGINQQVNLKPLAQLDLNLSMSNMTKVPLEQLNSNLRSLDLKQNKIALLPEDLFDMMPQLFKMHLDCNQLTSLPDSFKQVSKSLKYFTASQNQIEKIPKTLFECTLLEKLDLSSNQLNEIPSELGNLAGLKFLYLSENKFIHLPKTLSHLVNLLHFSLDWFVYLDPYYDKQLKRNSITEKEPLTKVLQTLAHISETHPILTEFCQAYYKQPNQANFLNEFTIFKDGNNIIQLLSKYNHHMIFDSIPKESKQLINVNKVNDEQLDALQIAIENGSLQMVDKIIRQFKDTINLTDRKSSTLHPIIMAIKHQMYETALKLLSIMIKQHKEDMSLDLNLKDENDNTLFHLLFANIAQNMELSVEICQELLKCADRRDRKIILKLNEMNKQGQTPVDLAIEAKQNLALEFAIYYNKNLLPIFQNSKSSSRREVFDLNFNKNSRALSPLHRAVLSLNYKALYLLFSSNEANPLLKDADFKSARDYCKTQLWISKYIKKGENNFISEIISKKMESSNLISPRKVKSRTLRIQMSLHVNQLKKKQNIIHNYLNLFYMSKRQNRVKYNSWYKKIESNPLRLLGSNSQQVTVENRNIDDKSKMRTGENPSSDEESIKIEDVKDDFDEEYYKNRVEIQRSIINSNLNNSNSEDLNEENGQLRIKMPDMITGSTIVGTQSISTGMQDQSMQSPKFKKLDLMQMYDRRLSGKGRQSNQSSIISMNRKTSNNNFQNSSALLNQSPRNRTILKNQNSQIIESPNQNETQFGSPQDDQEEDSPSHLLSRKFKYVLPTVNNSSIARKPYFKQIQQNMFLNPVAILLDPQISHLQKIQTLYSLISTLPQMTLSQKQDALEVFDVLLSEIKRTEPSEEKKILKPLRKEIEYFNDQLQSQMEKTDKLNPKELVTPFTNGNQRKNTMNNYSLERGPLPMIQELNHEHSTNFSPAPNTNKGKFFEQQISISLSKRSSSKNINQGIIQVLNVGGQESRQNAQSNYIEGNSGSGGGGTQVKSGSTIVEGSESKVNQQNSMKVNGSHKSLKEVNQQQNNTSLTKSTFQKKHVENKQLRESSIASNSQPMMTSSEIETFHLIESQKSPISPSILRNQNQGQRNQAFLFQSPATTHGLRHQKDSCIKKVEVQITTQETPQQNASDKNKWKQLTINPTQGSTLNGPASVGKGGPKIGIQMGLTIGQANKISTPQSAKTSTTNQLSSSQIHNQSQHNFKQQIHPATAITSSRTAGNISRSTSNPRNSLISGGKLAPHQTTGTKVPTTTKVDLSHSNTTQQQRSNVVAAANQHVRTSQLKQAVNARTQNKSKPSKPSTTKQTTSLKPKPK